MKKSFWNTLVTPCNQLKVSWRFGNVGCCQLLVSGMVYSPAMQTEATCYSETSADFLRITRQYIPEDIYIHNHLSENLKSYTEIYYVPYNFNSLFWSHSYCNNSYINTHINSNSATFYFSSVDKPHNIQVIQQLAQTSCKISHPTDATATKKVFTAWFRFMEPWLRAFTAVLRHSGLAWPFKMNCLHNQQNQVHGHPCKEMEKFCEDM
jgi:hypothetical protein